MCPVVSTSSYGSLLLLLADGCGSMHEGQCKDMYVVAKRSNLRQVSFDICFEIYSVAIHISGGTSGSVTDHNV